METYLGKFQNVTWAMEEYSDVNIRQEEKHCTSLDSGILAGNTGEMKYQEKICFIQNSSRREVY